MSTLPLTEAILLEIHQSLGCQSFQTTKKDKFATAQDSLATHKAMGEEVLHGIFNALGMDPGANVDAIDTLTDFGSAYKVLELNTWTFDADPRQILWGLLGYFYMPGLARHAAFWNLGSPLDRGMPGGRFWYLPEPREVDGKPSLYLPVAQVVDWLLDLLGMPLEAFADARSESTDGDHDALRRSLYNWRSNTTIRPDSFRKYFPDETVLNFKGTFVLDGNRSPAERFADALAFVGLKKLTADKLRLEIPMTREGRLEAILEGVADEDERAEFVGHLAVRYAAPSPKTIRQRLLFARMVQDGYGRLLKSLCPGVDQLCADARQNKLLQLFAIYKCVYNLTIDAWRACSDQGEAAENAWFEERLPPWDTNGLYLSILPSRCETSNNELALVLTRQFCSMQAGEELEDHVGYDEESTKLLITRNTERAAAIADELKSQRKLVADMKRSSPWRALQNEHRFWVVCQAAQHTDLNPCEKQAAIQRLRELAATPGETVQAIISELDRLLNGERKQRPQDDRNQVQALLEEAEASEGYTLWKAAILQYKAKHLLACNDFKGAEKHFVEALNASFDRNYGRLRGEVARDCMATAVANQRLIPENHQRYYREMLAGGIVEGAGIPGIEDTASWAADFFWSTLYVPYPGVERLAPIAIEKCKEAFNMMMAGDMEGLRHWVERNRSKINANLPLVTGDSLLMHLIKFHDNFLKITPAMLLKNVPQGQEVFRHFDMLLERWRNAVVLMCQNAPRQLNTADFKGQTPLMLVSEAGDTELVGVLLKAGADPDKQDWQGMTALHSAIKSRIDRCVDALLNHPCQLNKVTCDGRSPLHTAAWTANSHAVKRLLQLAPELAWQRDANGMTPLELVEYLIEDPNALQVLAEEYGRNGGHCPSKQELMEVAQLLDQAPPIDRPPVC